MSDYNEYRSHEIQSLNQTKIWQNTPIAIQSKRKKTKKTKNMYYATNDATLNGRKYVALPSDVNVSDPEVKSLIFMIKSVVLKQQLLL